MKYKFFFTLLFLLPTFLFALSEKECDTKYQNATEERRDAETKFNSFKECDASQIDDRIQLLRDAILCCSNAIKELEDIKKTLPSMT